MNVAWWIAKALEVYAGLGFAFAIWFAVQGAAAIDPAVKQSPIGFRLLLVPGSAALWPFLLMRWIKP